MPNTPQSQSRLKHSDDEVLMLAAVVAFSMSLDSPIDLHDYGTEEKCKFCCFTKTMTNEQWDLYVKARIYYCKQLKVNMFWGSER